MRRILLTTALLAACGSTVQPGEPPPATQPSDSTPLPDGGPVPVAAPAGPTLAGCPVFTAESEWNRDVSGDPVDARSTEYLAAMDAATMKLQPDFGVYPYGQPFVVVDSSQPAVPVAFRYASQSDPGPYPYPQDVPLQVNEDRHAAVVDKDRCKLYETYSTYADGQGGYRADSGAVFDLRSSALRPDGWTSARASGLPVLPGLVRLDEASQGEIRHALAFIAGATAHAYVHPATHSSGTSNDSSAPPMGLRVRLRADFALAGFTGHSLVVLKALQRYGMFLVDNGTPLFWALSGEQNPSWKMDDLEQLKRVPASAFEVVRTGEIHSGL